MNRNDVHKMEAVVRSANPVAEPTTLVGSDLASAVTLLVEEGMHVPASRRTILTRAVAFSAAFVLVVVAVGLAAVLIGGNEAPVSDEPAPPATPTTQPQPSPPPSTAVGGVITIEITNLVGAEGQDLAGVLMHYDPESPGAYKWDGVAGFAVAADADPFSTSVTLGNVDADWGEGAGMWPWASGVATVPAGEYSLQLWSGTDYCCYSRWMPAATPGLRGCEMTVKTTGHDQTIRIAGFSDDYRCEVPTDVDTGAIYLSIDDWDGLKGYQVLAVVWTEDQGELVGGAFWTTVHEGRFNSLADVVHPAVDPRLPTPEPSEWSDWAADDYVWTETAQLTPGRYRVHFHANPGVLHPYGSHIPTAAERFCWIELEVAAGETSVASISGIPSSREQCPIG